MSYNVKFVFSIFGPHEIPCEKKKNGKLIPVDCKGFWSKDELKSLCESRGCYIFAFKHGSSYRPIYVGKTTKCYEYECFSSHKVAKHYNPALMDVAKGTPVMFFIVAPKKSGKPNERKISSLEKYLIDLASSKNPRLSNIQNKAQYEWGINGVFKGNKGARKKDIKEFKKMLF